MGCSQYAHYGNIHQCLAVNLYNLRQNRQWTMNELAVLTRIPVHVLVKIEQGVNRINLDDLDVLADVFEVEVGALFGG
jgi:transcriptional regulator with XRE-family HTH domain